VPLPAARCPALLPTPAARRQALLPQPAAADPGPIPAARIPAPAAAPVPIPTARRRCRNRGRTGTEPGCCRSRSSTGAAPLARNITQGFGITSIKEIAMYDMKNLTMLKKFMMSRTRPRPSSPRKS